MGPRDGQIAHRADTVTNFVDEQVCARAVPTCFEDLVTLAKSVRLAGACWIVAHRVDTPLVPWAFAIRGEETEPLLKAKLIIFNETIPVNLSINH